MLDDTIDDLTIGMEGEPLPREAGTPEGAVCRKCGCVLTEGNQYPSFRKKGSLICKLCVEKKTAIPAKPMRKRRAAAAVVSSVREPEPETVVVSVADLPAQIHSELPVSDARARRIHEAWLRVVTMLVEG